MQEPGYWRGVLSPSSHTSAGILFKQGPTLTQVGHLHVVENDLDSQILSNIRMLCGTPSLKSPISLLLP